MTDRCLTCTCGKIHWHVAATAPGLHLKCYCADCQAFARQCRHVALLDRDGGTDIFQTLPRNVSFVKGPEHLALLQLSPAGLLRWHAECCGTPIANTLPNTVLPFVGVILPQGSTGFGKVVARVHTDAARGPVASQGMARAVWGVLGRGALGKLSRRGRRTPFFTDAGQPICDARVLTASERAALA